METKQNCWEFKACGRGPGGAKVKDLGTCPAATEERIDGIHEGKNAGRACWVVAGTFCGGKPRGSFVNKYDSCTKCDFYNLVDRDEGPGFLTPTTLLGMLRIRLISDDIGKKLSKGKRNQNSRGNRNPKDPKKGA